MARKLPERVNGWNVTLTDERGKDGKALVTLTCSVCGYVYPTKPSTKNYKTKPPCTQCDEMLAAKADVESPAPATAAWPKCVVDLDGNERPFTEADAKTFGLSVPDVRVHVQTSSIAPGPDDPSIGATPIRTATQTLLSKASDDLAGVTPSVNDYAALDAYNAGEYDKLSRCKYTGIVELDVDFMVEPYLHPGTQVHYYEVGKVNRVYAADFHTYAVGLYRLMNDKPELFGGEWGGERQYRYFIDKLARRVGNEVAGSCGPMNNGLRGEGRLAYLDLLADRFFLAGERDHALIDLPIYRPTIADSPPTPRELTRTEADDLLESF